SPIIFFSSLLRSPSILPLFPYTTLFRSGADDLCFAHMRYLLAHLVPFCLMLQPRCCSPYVSIITGWIQMGKRFFCKILGSGFQRSEEHTSELQSRFDLVCRLLLEKKKTT